MLMQNKMSKQAGFSTVLGVLLAAAMMLSIFSLYDVGQVTTHKMRAQNAADAAAYSVATITARDMNFIATTNRAMVANQVAIGQMVGLSSYSHMIEQTASNMDTITDYLQWIPFAGPVLNAITKALEAAADAMVEVFDAAAKFIIPISDKLIGVSSVLQDTFHLAMTGAAYEVYNDVIDKNDGDIESSVVLGGYSVVKYIDEYSDTLERNKVPKPNNTRPSNKRYLKRFDQFTSVIGGSTDKFIRSRRNNSLFGTIRSRGASEFKRAKVNNKYVWDWTAMDTTYFRLKISLGFIDLVNVKIPLGWGAGHALNTSRSGDNYYYPRRGNRNYAGAWESRWAGMFAYYADGSNNLSGTKNLRPFYDLKDDGLVDTGPGMVALLKKPAKATRVWKEASKNINGYDVKPKFDVAEQGGIAKDQMVTLAKAEPYFSRAPDLWKRNDNHVEFGNMYNPFWQARLTKASTVDHAAALLFASGFKL